jgi:branched-chain amino acid transport system ATP-binding protein
MTPFLEVKDMRKSYGAIRAVDGVTLSVGPGEIVGVIGPNGSGKTTLFNSILGQIKPTAGSVEFCGEDITGMSPLELSRRGVGRTFQTLQVFVKLSVRDNLIAAAQEFKGTMTGRLFASPDAGLGHHADQMIELFRLKHVAHLPAGSLSYGQQKLIDIAMAFMPAPRLVLLDEPCASARHMHGRGQGAGRRITDGGAGQSAGARGISWQLSLEPGWQASRHGRIHHRIRSGRRRLFAERDDPE